MCDLGQFHCLYDTNRPKQAYIPIEPPLYICPNHTGIGIHPDNSYLDTLEQPCMTTLRNFNNILEIKE